MNRPSPKQKATYELAEAAPFFIEPQLGEIRVGKEIGKKNHPYGKFKWLACPRCQRARWVMLSDIKKLGFTGLCLSCSSKRICALIKNRPHPSLDPNWCGCRRQDSHGYIRLKISPLNLFYPMADKRGYVREHRLIMAKHLNRCLLPWEVVHHKGTKYPSGSIENKSDNRIENLQLLPEQRWHLIDARTKNYIKALESKIAILEKAA